MTSLNTEAAFERAVEIVHSLPKNGAIQTQFEDKLSLYGLYKQAVQGDNTANRPGLLDQIGRAKHDAWAKQRGLTSKQAKELYVDKLLKVLKAFKDKPAAVEFIRELESYAGKTLSMESTDEDSASSADEIAPLPNLISRKAVEGERDRKRPSQGSLVAAARQARARESRGDNESDDSGSGTENETQALYRRMMSAQSLSASQEHFKPIKPVPLQPPSHARAAPNPSTYPEAGPRQFVVPSNHPQLPYYPARPASAASSTQLFGLRSPNLPGPGSSTPIPAYPFQIHRPPSRPISRCAA